MGSDLDYWREDNDLLALIGEVLFHSDTQITVRLPRALARSAVVAWERNDVDDHAVESETWEERIVRHRAGSLGLIGLALQEGGKWGEAEVEVSLDAWFVGDALNCADDHGKLHGPPRDRKR